MLTMSPQRCSVLVLLLLATTGYCSRPRVEIIPAHAEIFLGSQASFLCKSSTEATFKWLTENDDEIEDEAKRYKVNHLDETQVSLVVTASKIEPDRVIRCYAEPESGEGASREIKLKIIQKPGFVKDVETRKEFTADTTAQLPCAVEGIPKPQVTWYRNNVAIPIQPGVGRLSATNEGTLSIKKIQLSDAGLYYCQAYIRDRNEIAFKNVSVIVNAAPVVSFEDSSPKVDSNSNATFICEVTGHPAPQITWRKGEEKVQHDGQKYILSSNGIQLSITDLAKDDEGEYTCHAINRLGEHNTTFILEVIEPQKGVGAGVITGIILLLLLVTLLAVDLTCYRTRRRGFLMYISTNILGRPNPRVKLEENDLKKGNSDKSHVVNISGIDA